MKRSLCILLTAAFALAAIPSSAEPPIDKYRAKRQAIDLMASDAMVELLSNNEAAKETFSQSVAYAVFDNFKVSLLISGGGGVGVAVDNQTGERTYMKMGSGGIGLGVGGQSYMLIFMFENPETFRHFVDNGWQADASANAAVGTSGKNAGATFRNGVAVFQMTHKGLVAQVDVSGTRYWKSKALNKP